MARILPRFFSEQEVLTARDYLQRFRAEDWATLCANQITPVEEDAAGDLTVRLVQALIKGGFADNIVHAGMLLEDLVMLVRGEPRRSMPSA